MSSSSNIALDAFNTPYQVALERAVELTQYKIITVYPRSDSKDDTEAPIMSLFIEANGSDSIQKVKNFTVPEIEKLYRRLQGIRERTF